MISFLFSKRIVSLEVFLNLNDFFALEVEGGALIYSFIDRYGHRSYRKTAKSLDYATETLGFSEYYNKKSSCALPINPVGLYDISF